MVITATTITGWTIDFIHTTGKRPRRNKRVKLPALSEDHKSKIRESRKGVQWDEKMKAYIAFTAIWSRNKTTRRRRFNKFERVHVKRLFNRLVANNVNPISYLKEYKQAYKIYLQDLDFANRNKYPLSPIIFGFMEFRKALEEKHKLK